MLLGVVDGTHIRITRPHNNENIYVCRRMFHSINVQVVCDHRHMITSFKASHPGSMHDSTIFQESILCQEFEAGQHRGLLIGDSGYRLLRFLLTPYRVLGHAWQIAYNNSLKKTRVIIEMTIGILKRRFAVLHGEVRVQPRKAVRLICACVILHNIARARNEPEELLEDEEEEDDDLPGADQDAHPDNQTFRDDFARNVFG